MSDFVPTQIVVLGVLAALMGAAGVADFSDLYRLMTGPRIGF